MSGGHDGESPDDALRTGTGTGTGDGAGTGDGTGRGAGRDSGAGTGGGTGSDDGRGAGAESDEDALRRLMQESVSGLEPSSTSLDDLKKAVPARRMQRRQVFVGAAAAVVLAGLGLPVLAQAGFVPGLGDDRPVNAGSSHPQSLSPDGKHAGAQQQGAESAGKGQGEQGGPAAGRGDAGSVPYPSAGSSGEATDPSDTLAANAPACVRDQLGSGTAESGAPDAQGHVYGSFRVVNTSTELCAVNGEGMVAATAGGRADVSRVTIVDHTPGDDATGLPDPTTARDSVVLRAGEAYTVRFAWIPDSCPAQPSPSTKPEGVADGSEPQSAGGSSGGSTDGGSGTGGDDSSGGGGDTGGSGGTGDAGGTGGTGGTGDVGEGTDGGDAGGSDGGDTGGDSGDGSAEVTLSHTPEAGDPAAAKTTIDGTCAGTLYRTGPLPAE